jgi:hypothetical protein
VDGDENGEIDYEEFVSMMTKVVKSLEQKKEEWKQQNLWIGIFKDLAQNEVIGLDDVEIYPW